MTSPGEADLDAVSRILGGSAVTDALVATLVARLRTLRVLLESHDDEIDPVSPTGQLHARVSAMEARIEARLRPAEAGDGPRDVFYVD